MLAWILLGLCVLPLILGYAFASIFAGVALADANKRVVRDFVAAFLLTGAGVLIVLALLRSLSPPAGDKRHAKSAPFIVMALLFLPVGVAGRALIDHAGAILSAAVLGAGIWAWRRGLPVWPLVVFASAAMLLFVPGSRYLAPGAGLLALVLLVVRLRAYTLDRIPPLVWFGLALGVVFSLTSMGWQAAFGAWQAGSYVNALKQLYWGGGAILCALTGLLAIRVGRLALEDEVVDATVCRVES